MGLEMRDSAQLAVRSEWNSWKVQMHIWMRRIQATDETNYAYKRTYVDSTSRDRTMEKMACCRLRRKVRKWEREKTRTTKWWCAVFATTKWTVKLGNLRWSHDALVHWPTNLWQTAANQSINQPTKNDTFAIRILTLTTGSGATQASSEEEHLYYNSTGRARATSKWGHRSEHFQQPLYLIIWWTGISTAGTVYVVCKQYNFPVMLCHRHHGSIYQSLRAFSCAVYSIHTHTRTHTW